MKTIEKTVKENVCPMCQGKKIILIPAGIGPYLTIPCKQCNGTGMRKH